MKFPNFLLKKIIKIVHVFYFFILNICKKFFFNRFKNLKLIFFLFLIIISVTIFFRFFKKETFYFFYFIKYNRKLQEYIDKHNKIILVDDNFSKISFNISPVGGYGNKLYSFLSSLLIGILSDSAVIVYWNFNAQNMGYYIESPLKNMFMSELMLNKTSFFNPNYIQEEICYQEPSQAWKLKKNISLLVQTSLNINCNRFMYKNISSYFMELCCNPIYFNKLLYYNLVSNTTIKKAYKAVKYKNLNEIRRQEFLFSVGYEVAGNLLNYFWIPRKDLIKKIDYYLNKEFKNSYVIGIQLRYFYLNKLFDTTKFIDCALQIENKYKALIRKKINGKNKIKWFISSDSQSHIDEIFSVYGDRAFTNGAFTHVFDDPVGYDKAIIDIELLSRCDELIITGGSTFGFIASMKSLKLPFYVNGKDLNMKHCVKHTLSGSGISKTQLQDAIF